MINDSRLDALRRAVDDLERIVGEAADLGEAELKRELKHMDTAIGDFIDSVSDLENALTEAQERAEDEEGEDREEESSEEDEEED